MRGDIDQLLIADHAADAYDALSALVDPGDPPEKLTFTIETDESLLRNVCFQCASAYEIFMELDTALGALGALRAGHPDKLSG